MPTKPDFLRDVKDHVIEIIRDGDINRHIRFRKPGSMCMHFDLITWPGYLCYTGDMGTYVFSRLDDMFQFFRKDPDQSIDFRYWAEKLQAVDASMGKGSATEFDPERFKEVINGYRLRWIKDGRDALTKVQRRELWEAVDDEVLHYLDQGEHTVFDEANRFQWQAGVKQYTYSFNDLWDLRFTRHTYHFLWCCHALAWGINLYDKTTKP